ncbi:MAG: hypothetical protein ACKVW3_17695 [Phycisphaerales bacterium]
MTDSKHTDRIVAGTGAAPAIDEWWRGLLWPRLLTAVALGLRPGRVGLAFVGLAATTVLLGFGLQFDTWIGRGRIAWPALASAQPALVWDAAIATPLALVRGAPITTLVMGPFVLALWGVLLGAISRLAALEMGLGQFGAWHDGLNFAAARWRSLVGVALGPAIVVWTIALLLAAAGWIIQWPVANVIGALLLGLALLAGLFAVVVALGLSISHGLCIAAVASDGADAIDAVQRGFAYLFSRPLRLFLYMFLAGLGVTLVAVVSFILLIATLDFVGRGLGIWMSNDRAIPFVGPLFGAALGLGTGTDDLTGTALLTSRIVGFWAGAAAMLAQAVVISGWMGATTAVYLAIRRACDGQDPADLYVPGAMEAAMSDAAAARVTPGMVRGGAPLEGDA